ncbi:MAG: nucleoside deaminase [Crocinitomicaceae bacterium]|nr:nucleoside deaminase [Crocinitomicaceae bacterium]MDG1659418.1 nucleoside deaminase [Crocinitomicaceae bacterium]|tara:strand:+ start:1806 stop:2279 length:474 start_codon:yes stop_codon:yes gene_type:complete
MEEQKEFMREAIRISRENVATGNGGPFGAVVVKNSKIIASGGNEVTSSNDPTAHAEVVAIRRACEELGTFQLEDCEIYCTCEPCPMCLGAIYWARPSKIYFANTKKDAADINFDDDFIYQEIEIPNSERSLPTIQLLRDEAIEVFQEWTNSTTKIEY